MANLYFATSQKATGVTHAAVGDFTAPADLNLVLGKTNRVEVYRITPEGLSAVYDVGIYGRISTLRLMRIAVRRACRGNTGVENDSRGEPARPQAHRMPHLFQLTPPPRPPA
jgi:hypothetical protein